MKPTTPPIQRVYAKPPIGTTTWRPPSPVFAACPESGEAEYRQIPGSFPVSSEREVMINSLSTTNFQPMSLESGHVGQLLPPVDQFPNDVQYFQPSFYEEHSPDPELNIEPSTVQASVPVAPAGSHHIENHGMALLDYSGTNMEAPCFANPVNEVINCPENASVENVWFDSNSDALAVDDPPEECHWSELFDPLELPADNDFVINLNELLADDVNGAERQAIPVQQFQDHPGNPIPTNNIIGQQSQVYLDHLILAPNTVVQQSQAHPECPIPASSTVVQRSQARSDRPIPTCNTIVQVSQVHPGHPITIPNTIVQRSQVHPDHPIPTRNTVVQLSQAHPDRSIPTHYIVMQRSQAHPGHSIPTPNIVMQRSQAHPDRPILTPNTSVQLDQGHRDHPIPIHNTIFQLSQVHQDHPIPTQNSILQQSPIQPGHPIPTPNTIVQQSPIHTDTPIPTPNSVAQQSSVQPEHPVSSRQVDAISNPLPTASAGKTRMTWTPSLNRKFLDAASKLGGIKRATPKGILELMGEKDLTIHHVKSHLQKLRAADNGKEPSEGNLELEIISTEGTLELKETLQLQMELKKQLDEQFKNQKKLQLQVEEHAQQIKLMFEGFDGPLSSTSNELAPTVENNKIHEGTNIQIRNTSIAPQASEQISNRNTKRVRVDKTGPFDAGA